jgi:hypothetical protein
MRVDSTLFFFSGKSPGTTVQDQYLIMLMLSLLSSGNLTSANSIFPIIFFAWFPTACRCILNMRRMPALLCAE